MFLFSDMLLFVNKYHYFIEAYTYVNATLKFNFKKLKPVIFFNFHYRVIHQYTLCILKPSYVLSGVQVLETVSLQCNSLSQIHLSVYFRLKMV